MLLSLPTGRLAREAPPSTPPPPGACGGLLLSIAPNSCSHLSPHPPPAPGWAQAVWKPHTSLPALSRSPPRPPLLPADFICLMLSSLALPSLSVPPPTPPELGPGQASSSGSRAGAGDGLASQLRE